jgi:hypothetical protein
MRNRRLSVNASAAKSSDQPACRGHACVRHAGAHASRLRAEIAAPRLDDEPAEEPQRKTETRRAQYAELPDSASGGPRKRESRRDDDVDEEDEKRLARHRATARAELRAILPAVGNSVDALIDDVVAAANRARERGTSAAEREQLLGRFRERIRAISAGNIKLHRYLLRGTKAAFAAAEDPDANLEDTFLKTATGTAPSDRAEAEIAAEEKQERRARQRQADERFAAFKRERPAADYAEQLAEIARIAKETGALPASALAYLRPDLSPRDNGPVYRLRDPQKVVAQLETIRAIADSGAAADALPQSLLDLAADYEAVSADPKRPRDPEQFVYAVFRHGAPRRLREVGEVLETVAEVATPYGYVVSLNDAWRSAQQAYEAFRAGRDSEALEKSGEALWHLVMAAPVVGNIRRGIKGAERLGVRSAEGNIRPHNVARGARAERYVVNTLRRDFEAHGLTVGGRETIHTRLGDTIVDSTIRTNHDLVAHVEVKSRYAAYRNPQRDKQATLPNMYFFRADGRNREIRVFKVEPGLNRSDYVWEKGMRCELWKDEFLKSLRRRDR